jgi:hypothetical protein
MILVLSRGGFCPKDRRQHEGLVQFHRELEVGYCRLVTISTDNITETNEFRTGMGAHWPFLSDTRRLVQKDLDIAEYTDPDHNPMIPYIPIGALLATLTGWQGTFMAIAAVSAVTAVAVLLKVPAHLRGTRIPLRERAITIAKPGMLPILATTLLIMAGGFSVFMYLAPLAVEGAGLPAVIIPGLLLAWGVGAALGNFIGGQVADRYGARATAILAVLGLGAILAIISLAAKLLSPAIAGPALIGLTVLWGIMGWMTVPAQVSRLVALHPASAPISLSLTASALYLGVAFGSVLGGVVINVGTPADLGWIGAIPVLLALVIVLATGGFPLSGGRRVSQRARCLNPGVKPTAKRLAAPRVSLLIYHTLIEKGGYVAAWEQPMIFAQELRAAFRVARLSEGTQTDPLRRLRPHPRVSQV